MTEEQIKQNAEEYASKVAPTIKSHKTGIPLAINHTAKVSFIKGAHSRDEEVASLLSQLEDKDGYIAHLREELNKLRNPWINASKQLPPEDKEGSNLSIDCLVMACDGNSFFYVIAWYDYEGRCWYEKYDFDQTYLDGNRVFYWMKLPKCNHIETEGGDK